MCQAHIGLVTWYGPKDNIIQKLAYVDDGDIPDSGIMGVGAQGTHSVFPGNDNLTLLPMDPYMPQTEKRWLDVFIRANDTFSYNISINASYVSVTNSNGTLTAPGNKSDSRSVITVDWDNGLIA